MTGSSDVCSSDLDPALPDEGPASRLTKLSVNISGGFALDIDAKM